MKRDWIRVVARELRKSPRTIRIWAAQGEITGVWRSRQRGHYRIRDKCAFKGWFEKKYLSLPSNAYEPLPRKLGEKQSDYWLRDSADFRAKQARLRKEAHRIASAISGDSI
jgi:hypothetical protein